MKVLHISTPMSWRGGEQQLANLIDELARKNISQWVLCSSHSAMSAYCKKNKINSITQRKPSSFSFMAAFRIAKLCKNLEIDLMHVHDSHAHSLAVLANVLFHGKTSIILSGKVDYPIRNNWYSHFKFNHHSIKAIISVSKKISEIIAPDIKNKKIISTVYDGIDFLRFKFKNEGLLRKEFGISSDELIIGNVAALAPHKDYFTFVDTAEIILKKKIKAKFLIIGSGPDKNKIENYISSKKLQTQVLLMGFRNNIPQLLPEFDIFLFSSKTEGLGSSILDAYTCEVPVVATSAGGVPEIVIDHKTGLVSPPQNALLLAENILKLMENEALRNQLKKNAKEFVLNFSKERNAEQIFAIYTEVIKKAQ